MKCSACYALSSFGKVFRIGTVRYHWPMSAHASQAFSIASCTDSEDLSSFELSHFYIVIVWMVLFFIVFLCVCKHVMCIEIWGNIDAVMMQPRQVCTIFIQILYCLLPYSLFQSYFYHVTADKLFNLPTKWRQVLLNGVDGPGMGTRRKSSRPRPRRSLPETRPRHWLHQLRQDRDETFVAFETWSRC